MDPPQKRTTVSQLFTHDTLRNTVSPHRNWYCTPVTSAKQCYVYIISFTIFMFATPLTIPNIKPIKKYSTAKQRWTTKTNSPWWWHYYTRRNTTDWWTVVRSKRQSVITVNLLRNAQNKVPVAVTTVQVVCQQTGGNKQNLMTLHETLMCRPEKSHSTTVNPDKKKQFILLFRPKMPSPRSTQD